MFFIGLCYNEGRKINHIVDVAGIIRSPIIMRGDLFMLDFDCIKEYGLPIEESLRSMRIRKYPVQLNENMIFLDRLESLGTINILENTGGVLNLPVDMEPCGMEHITNAVQVAEIKISVFQDERKVQLDRLYCEYGYDEELVPVLLEQVINFSDFYNYMFCIPNLKVHKQQARSAFGRGKAIAAQML